MLYFQSVVAWVKATFPVHRKKMKAVEWGSLYNKFKDVEYDPAKLEVSVAELMADEDVTKKRGIYPYRPRVIAQKACFVIPAPPVDARGV